MVATLALAGRRLATLRPHTYASTMNDSGDGRRETVPEPPRRSRALVIGIAGGIVFVSTLAGLRACANAHPRHDAKSLSPLTE